MRILLGSDYHCSDTLQAEALRLLPTVDLYINCGDFCTKAGRMPKAAKLGCHPNGLVEMARLETFLKQVDKIGVPWWFIPGNHEPPAATMHHLRDRIGSDHGQIFTGTELVSLAHLNVLVVPLTPACGYWGWALGADTLAALQTTYSGQNVDILVSHAPPLGYLDEGGKWYKPPLPTLRPLVDAIAPRYYFCGHMHHDGGRTVTSKTTTFINAALHNLVLDIN